MSNSSATIRTEQRADSTAGARFTPGPWVLENSSTGEYDISCRTKDGLYGGWFLTLDPGIPTSEAAAESREEFEANAHLISAAPDMYEALKALLPIAMGSEAYAFSAQGSGKAVEAAEAALKKADGR